MNHLIAILVQFLLGERFRRIVTNFLAKTLKKVLKRPRKRKSRKKGRGRGRKEEVKQMTAGHSVYFRKEIFKMTTIHEIQKEFLNRVQDPDNALLTVEGIMYDLSLDEGGLRDTEDEVSYCGITEETFGEFRQYDPTVTIESVREITTLTTEAAADLITRVYMWYFQKPPKQNFFALPKLLWNIVCNASLLAPYPVIIRIQQLVGDPNPDGIWGSGTNKRIETFFEGKSVAEIEQFALDFTQAIEARYRELGQNPEFAETADAWIDRAYRKLQQMRDYIVAQQRAANIDSPVSPTTQALAAVPPTPQQAARNTPAQVAPPTPETVVQSTPQQVVPPTPEVAAPPTPEVADKRIDVEGKQVIEQAATVVGPEAAKAAYDLQVMVDSMNRLSTALEEHNVVAKQYIELGLLKGTQETAQAEQETATPPAAQEQQEGGGALGAAAAAAKKALNVAEVATNPVGAAKKALESIIP